MTHDSGFWTWPVDVAATRTRSRPLAIVSAALYWAGALILLARSAYAWPAAAGLAGVVLILLGVAGSVGIVGKVLLTRSRLQFH